MCSLIKRDVMIIGVTGGKGGTGKSLISVALARMLSKEHRVITVDTDVECPNDHLILGVDENALKKIEHVKQFIPVFNTEKCKKCGLCGKVCRKYAIVSVKNRYPVFISEQCNGCKACMLACPTGAISTGSKIIGTIKFAKVNDNLDLLTGELVIGEEEPTPIVNSLKTKLLSRFLKKYDFSIVDTAAGIKCNVISALEIVDLAVVVTEPTPFGIHDAELTLKIINTLAIPSKIVINKATIGDATKIYALARKYGVEVIAEVPYDRELFMEYSAGRINEIEELENFVKWVCSTKSG